MKRTTPIPDIWGARDRKEELQARCKQRRYATWLAELTSKCDDALDKAVASPETRTARSAAEQAESHAWAWLLTDDDRYADAARAQLAAVGSEASGWAQQYHTDMYPRDRADLQVSETIKASAAALSILDPVLDEEQRGRLADICCITPGRIIYEDAQAGCWWGTALNSNWTAVLNSALGFAGIVALGQAGEEGKAWVGYCRARIGEMLDLAAEDAGGVEGPSYWIYCFGSAQDFAVAEQATGHSALLAHPFWAKAARYLLYFVRPDFSGWLNYGDTPYDTMAGSHVFHGIARYTDDEDTRRISYGFAERMLEHHPNLRFKNLLYDDPNLEAAPADELSRSALFESVHLASFRSGWGAEDTLLFVRGGSNAWSHMHLDLGSFMLDSHGDRLAIDPGPIPYSVHYWHSIVDEVSTKWHNCMVVDNANQRVGAQYAMTNDLEEAGNCYARMYGHVSGDSVDLLSLDASAAYGDTLERYVRSFTFLTPYLVAVFDDCTTRPERVQRNFEWMLHSEYPMIDVGNTIVARGANSELRVHPLVPVEGEHKFVDGKTHPKQHGRPIYCVSVRPYWHHKWNVNPDKSPYPHWHPRGDLEPLYGNRYRFLNLLEIVPRGSTGMQVTPVAGDGPYAARIESADEWCLIAFNPDGEAISVDGIESDAKQIVVRKRADAIEWALAGGTRLSCDGTGLFEGQSPSDHAGVVSR